MYTNIPSFNVRTCYQATCGWDPLRSYDRATNETHFALANRANQIRLIGASYTLTAWPLPALPRMYDAATLTYTPAQRGSYRCDTWT